MPHAVADDPALLKALLDDANTASELWKPTAYWRNYTGRIAREIHKSGLAEFRSNHTICKGYAHGGVPEPIPPVARWKQIVWNAMLRAPVANTMFTAFRTQVAAEHRHRRRAEIRYAALVLDALAEDVPTLRIPAGLASGGADDAFKWRGNHVTASWVEQLCRIADFYSLVPVEKVRAIIEIGPGIGQSTLAHLALNPNLKTIVNIDIVPVLYVSTQFLKSSGEFEVVDYADIRGTEPIEIQSDAKKPRLYQLPPWKLPQVRGEFDYFFNAYSFQEMEKDVCRNYVDHLLPLLTRGTCLHSSVKGHAPNAGGQKEPVTLEFLSGLFMRKFPRARPVEGYINRLFEIEKGAAILLET